MNAVERNPLYIRNVTKYSVIPIPFTNKITHNGEKAYKCKQCGKDFFLWGDIYRHL
jgi:transposase-like protein